MKILLVEDNVKLNEATTIYLEDQGFYVDTAFNGVQALTKVKDLKKKDNTEYDVIILDRMMPMKDGIETLREIKNLGIGSNIIILTAKDTVDDKVFGLAAGADDYMVKPFNVKELTARIYSLYRRKIKENINDNIENNILNKNKFQENKEEKLKNNKDFINQNNNLKNNFNFNFYFDFNKSEIYLESKNNEKKIISLTNKESFIFNLLLNNENKFIKKDDILKEIWKEDEKPNSRFVDVHVHNLRSKLSENNFPGKIDSMRNLGYILIINK